MGVDKTNRLRPVLVTGSHRSGTTWVGRMLALDSSMAYLHEPFSPLTRSGICNIQFKNWFTYVCAENETSYIEPMRNTLQFRYELCAELRSTRRPKDLGRLVRDYCRFSAYRRRNKRPLVKDPIALFSAAWLASRFDLQVVVVIRHPLAFSGSLKKTGWGFSFSDFLDQPLMMKDGLEQFREQIEDFAGHKHDIVDQAILLWNILHHRILEYRETRPNWIYLKHEQLSTDPVVEFEKLCEQLGITFTNSAKSKIVDSSTTHNDVTETRVHNVQRNSIENLQTWQERLTADEIRRIEAGTATLVAKLYSDEEVAQWWDCQK